MTLIELHDKQIRLNSHLDEYSFGKTNYDSILAQEGVFWNGEDFTAWTFNDVQSFNVEGKTERIVFYCGENPLGENAKTLQEYMQADDSTSLSAAKAVCQMLTQAAKEDEAIPMVGAGGILVDLSAEKPQVLFVPEQLFKYAANALSPEEYTAAHEGWINQTIKDLPAISFMRANIVYRLLAKRLPYPNTKPVDRNADILDRNFLPLELCVQDIQPELARSVNRALKLNSNAVNVPGKKQKGRSSEDLTPEADFPLDLLDKAFELSQKNTGSNKDFEEKVEAYRKSQESRVKAKRNIRRNSTIIITGIIVFIVLILIGISTAQSKGEELTTTGLTSVETIQGFFQGVNNKNTTQLMNFVKGRNPQKHIDVVSQIYVLDKQRKAYSRDNGYGSPANWLLYVTSMDRWNNSGVYGVTQLKVDGQPLELNLEIHAKNEKVAPVTKEGNITINKGDNSVHTAEYYLIHTEGEDLSVIVEKVYETFTLTYKKDRWVITNMDTQSFTMPVSTRTFKSDYWNKLAENGGDAIKSVAELHSKYDWLPSEKAMQDEYDAQVYAATHPLEALGF